MSENVLRVLLQHLLKFADSLGQMAGGGELDCAPIAQILVESVLGVRTGIGDGSPPRAAGEVAQRSQTRNYFGIRRCGCRCPRRRVPGSQEEQPLPKASRQVFLSIVEVV